MLGLMPAVLVDLAGGPEAGLSANRIARDFGFTSCTVLVGAVTGLAGTVSGLISGVLLYVLVGIGMNVVGETRVQRSG